MGKGKSMSDVEKEIDGLQCKLTAKTREIETLMCCRAELAQSATKVLLLVTGSPTCEVKGAGSAFQPR